jgi:hypothetical protein
MQLGLVAARLAIGGQHMGEADSSLLGSSGRA